MSGWIEVFAPVFESKVNELNVIPMYWLPVAEQDELEVREIPVDRVRRLARVGDRRVDLGVDRQGRVGFGLEETERVALHRREPVDLDVESGRAAWCRRCPGR